MSLISSPAARARSGSRLEHGATNEAMAGAPADGSPHKSEVGALAVQRMLERDPMTLTHLLSRLTDESIHASCAWIQSQMDEWTRQLVALSAWSGSDLDAWCELADGERQAVLASGILRGNESPALGGGGGGGGGGGRRRASGIGGWHLLTLAVWVDREMRQIMRSGARGAGHTASGQWGGGGAEGGFIGGGGRGGRRRRERRRTRRRRCFLATAFEPDGLESARSASSWSRPNSSAGGSRPGSRGSRGGRLPSADVRRAQPPSLGTSAPPPNSRGGSAHKRVPSGISRTEMDHLSSGALSWHRCPPRRRVRWSMFTTGGSKGKFFLRESVSLPALLPLAPVSITVPAPPLIDAPPMAANKAEQGSNSSAGRLLDGAAGGEVGWQRRRRRRQQQQEEEEGIGGVGGGGGGGPGRRWRRAWCAYRRSSRRLLPCGHEPAACAAGGGEARGEGRQVGGRARPRPTPPHPRC